VTYLDKLERELSTWAGVSSRPHRFGAREFRFGTAEIGHIHTGGEVDIPFPRLIHDALLAQDLAEPHRWVPNSGWITFRLRDGADIKHALWLMRLSYLRYELKSATDPQALLDKESEELGLSSEIKSLFTLLLPKTGRPMADSVTI